MAFKKRQLILAGLVLALGSAVYLNWQFQEKEEPIAPDITTSSKELGQAQFVNNVPAGETPPVENKPERTSEFFKKSKSERQKARDEATDIIKEILSDPKSSEETKKEAVKQAGEIAKKIEKESGIENLIKSKGFSECLAFINNDECSLVVGGKKLDENLATAIKDIVCGQSDIAIEKVKIIESDQQ